MDWVSAKVRDLPNADHAYYLRTRKISGTLVIINSPDRWLLWRYNPNPTGGPRGHVLSLRALLSLPRGRVNSIQLRWLRPCDTIRMAPKAQKSPSGTKRPAENDGSVSPPPLKRKAQSAISSMSLQSVRPIPRLQSTDDRRIRRRKLLHAHLSETEGAHYVDRKKRRQQHPPDTTRRQICPRKRCRCAQDEQAKSRRI